MKTDDGIERPQMTVKQERIFDFISTYAEDHQSPPSFREIAAHFHVSVGTIQDQIDAIEKKGFISKRKIIARGLRLPVRAHQVPLLGQVHAGTMHAAYEDVESYVPVGSRLPTARHFALRVKGDSMIDAGLFEEDIIIVRKEETARDGDIVVARMGDETTVKTLRSRDGDVYLEPANPRYQPIRNTPFDIVGVVVEMRRQLERKSAVR